MKQQTEELSSSVPDERQESGSVFDFLYQDARRVASYLAQLNPAGHISGVKQILETEETGSRNASITAGASAAVAKATAGFIDHSGNTNRDTLERTIDPLWSNAVELLDLLQARDIIKYDLDHVGLGSFVLVSGEILILDTTHSRPSQTVPEVKNHLNRSLVSLFIKEDKTITLLDDPVTSSLDKRSREKRAQRDVKLMNALIATLPDSVHLRVRTEGGQVIHCPIVETGLITSATEITMTHGAKVQGIWHILGIYDAKPDNADVDIEDLATKFCLNQSQTLKSACGYAGLLRNVGRSDGLYGVTPLLVFRHIGISP